MPNKSQMPKSRTVCRDTSIPRSRRCSESTQAKPNSAYPTPENPMPVSSLQASWPALETNAEASTRPASRSGPSTRSTDRPSTQSQYRLNTRCRRPTWTSELVTRAHDLPRQTSMAGCHPHRTAAWSPPSSWIPMAIASTIAQSDQVVQGRGAAEGLSGATESSDMAHIIHGLPPASSLTACDFFCVTFRCGATLRWSRPRTWLARRLRRRGEERDDVAADHTQSAAHHRQARGDDQRRDRQDLAGPGDVLVPVLARNRLEESAERHRRGNDDDGDQEEPRERMETDLAGDIRSRGRPLHGSLEDRHRRSPETRARAHHEPLTALLDRPTVDSCLEG